MPKIQYVHSHVHKAQNCFKICTHKCKHIRTYKPKQNWTLEDIKYVVDYTRNTSKFIPELLCCVLLPFYWPEWFLYVNLALLTHQAFLLHVLSFFLCWEDESLSWPWSHACICSCRPYCWAARRNGPVWRKDVGHIRTWASKELSQRFC
jgi:hypothetical protein